MRAAPDGGANEHDQANEVTAMNIAVSQLLASCLAHALCVSAKTADYE